MLSSFDALMLLVEWEEEHPTRKNLLHQPNTPYYKGVHQITQFYMENGD